MPCFPAMMAKAKKLLPVPTKEKSKMPLQWHFVLDLLTQNQKELGNRTENPS